METAKAGVLMIALMSPWLCLAADQSCAACDVADSPYCLKLSSDEGNGASFKQLYVRFASGSHADISPPDLMRMFNLTSDPCKRSATRYAAGKWTNTGTYCRLTASFAISSLKTTVNTVLIVPDRLSLSTQTSGAVITAIPDSPAPLLKFADKNLDRDWGGFVEKVTADASRIMFKVRSGCIQVKYPPPK